MVSTCTLKALVWAFSEQAFSSVHRYIVNYTQLGPCALELAGCDVLEQPDMSVGEQVGQGVQEAD